MSSSDHGAGSGTEDKGAMTMVAIRMRPLNEREESQGQNAIWRCLPAYNSITQTAPDGSPLPDTKGTSFFTYDKIFGEDSDTRDIYDECARHLVQGLVAGVNGTIFAYGQTSSGKTYTMQGADGGKVPGIVHMAMADIFNSMGEHPGRVFLLRVSYLEIYNEEIRDLLNPDTPKLSVREDPRRGVYVDAKEQMINSYEGILAALAYGERQRHVDATEMNARSSRSHTIFRVVVESKADVVEGGLEEAEGDGVDAAAVLVATLNLVDLAGSESVRHTGATGARQKEGGKINQSLLSLSRVIQALSSAGVGSSGSGQHNQHVGFRDSKLTRILQPSLSGNASMAIICCATPADRFLEETRSTLQFAARAKMIKTHAKVNEVLDDRAKLKRVKKELDELRTKHQKQEELLQQQTMALGMGMGAGAGVGGRDSLDSAATDSGSVAAEMSAAAALAAAEEVERLEGEKAEQAAKIERLTNLILSANGAHAAAVVAAEAVNSSGGGALSGLTNSEGGAAAAAAAAAAHMLIASDLMDGDYSQARSTRAKRARETWCPGKKKKGRHFPEEAEVEREAGGDGGVLTEEGGGEDKENVKRRSLEPRAGLSASSPSALSTTTPFSSPSGARAFRPASGAAGSFTPGGTSSGNGAGAGAMNGHATNAAAAAADAQAVTCALKEEVDALKAKLAAQEGELSAAGEVKQELLEFSAYTEEVEKECEALREKLSYLQEGEKKDAERREDEDDVRVKELERELVAVQGKVVALGKEKDDAEAAAAAARGTDDVQQSLMKDLEERAERAEAGKATLEERVKHLEACLEDSASSVAAAAASSVAADSNVEEKVARLQEQLEASEAEKCDAQEEASRLEVAVGALEASSVEGEEQLKQQLKQAQEASVAHETALEACNARIVELETTLEARNGTLTELETTLEARNETIAELETTLEAWNDTFAEEQEQPREELRHSQSRVLELETLLRESEEGNSALEGQLAEALASVEEKQVLLETLEQQAAKQTITATSVDATIEAEAETAADERGHEEGGADHSDVVEWASAEEQAEDAMEADEGEAAAVEQQQQQEEEEEEKEKEELLAKLSDAEALAEKRSNEAAALKGELQGALSEVHGLEESVAMLEEHVDLLRTQLDATGASGAPAASPTAPAGDGAAAAPVSSSDEEEGGKEQDGEDDQGIDSSANLSERIASLRAQLNASELSRGEVEERHTSLLERVTQLADEAAASAAQHSEQNSERVALEEELVAVRERLAQAEEERSEARRALQDTSLRMEGLQVQLDLSVEMSKEHSNRASQTQEVLATVRDRVEELEAHIAAETIASEAASAASAARGGNNATTAAQAKSIEAEGEKEEDAAVGDTAAADDMQQQQQLLQAEIEALTAQLNTVQEGGQRDLDAARALAEGMEEKVLALEAELAAAAAVGDTAANTGETVEMERTQDEVVEQKQQQEEEEQRMQLAAEEAQMALEEELSSAKLLVEEQRARVAALESELMTVLEDSETLSEEMVKLSDDAATLKQQSAEKDDLLAKERVLLAEERECRADLEQQVGVLEELAEEARAKVELTTTQLKEAREAAAAAAAAAEAAEAVVEAKTAIEAEAKASAAMSATLPLLPFSPTATTATEGLHHPKSAGGHVNDESETGEGGEAAVLSATAEVRRLLVVVDHKSSELDSALREKEALHAELQETRGMYQAAQSSACDVTGSEESLQKRLGQLTCQLDLALGEKDHALTRLKETEAEMKRLEATSSREVDELQRQLSLTTPIADARESGAAVPSADEMWRLRESITALEGRIAALKKDKKEAEEVGERARCDALDLQGEVEVLQLKLQRSGDDSPEGQTARIAREQEAEEEKAALQKRVEEAVRGREEAIQRQGDVEADLRQQEQRCTRLQADVGMMREECERLGEEVMELEAGKRDLTGRVEQLEGELQEAVAANACTEKAEDSEKLTEAEAAAAAAKEDLAHAEELLAERVTECEEMRSALQTAQEEASALQEQQKRAEEAEAALLVTEHALTTARAEAAGQESRLLAEMSEQRASLMQEVEAAQGNAQAALMDVEGLQGRLTAAQDQMEEKEGQSKEEKMALEERLKAQAQARQEVVDELLQIREKLAQTEQQMATAGGDGEEEEKQEDEGESAQAAQREMLEQLENMMEEKQAAESRAASMQNELEQLRADVANAEQRAAEEQAMLMSAAQEKMAAYENKIETLTRTVESAQEDFEATAAALAQAQEEVQQQQLVIQQQAEEGQEESKRALQEAEAVQRELEEQLVVQQQVAKEAQDGMAALEATMVEKNARITQLESVRLTNEDVERLQKMHATARTHKATIKTLTKENKEVQEELEEVKVELSKATDALQALQAAKEEGGEEGEGENGALVLTQRVAELESDKTILSDKLRKYASHCQRLEAERSSIRSVIAHAMPGAGGDDDDDEDETDGKTLIDEVERLLSKMHEQQQLVIQQGVGPSSQQEEDEQVQVLKAKLREGMARFRLLEEQEAKHREQLEAAHVQLDGLRVEREDMVAQHEEALEAAVNAAAARGGGGGGGGGGFKMNEELASKVSFLEGENCALMVEIKGCKKELTQTRAELEALMSAAAAAKAVAKASASSSALLGGEEPATPLGESLARVGVSACVGSSSSSNSSSRARSTSVFKSTGKKGKKGKDGANGTNTGGGGSNNNSMVGASATEKENSINHSRGKPGAATRRGRNRAALLAADNSPGDGDNPECKQS